MKIRDNIKKLEKIFFFLILVIINHFILYKVNQDKAPNLKVAVCTMAKKDNLYIKEFLDYYIKLGVDHIFIYDNNEKKTEKFTDIIDKSYKNYVTIYKNIKYNIY